MIVNEIFYSIQGESKYSGYPTVFIRLTGCNLRCVYCDSKYSYHGGRRMSVEEIMTEIENFPCRLVCITGGEPLLHKKELPLLIENLAKKGYQVSVETSGSLPIAGLPAIASYILDLKTPSSGMEKHNFLENLPLLEEKDELKFVVGTLADLEFAAHTIRTHPVRCPIIISPVWEMAEKEFVAEWLLQNPLPQTRIGLQIHKVLKVA